MGLCFLIRFHHAEDAEGPVQMSGNTEIREYQARAVITAGAAAGAREVIVVFKGEPSSETFDLAVRLPVGCVAALMLQLREACIEMDRVTSDTVVAVQPVSLTGAKAASPVCGMPAVVLSMDGMEIPAVMPSIETARLIADALEAAASPGEGSARILS